MKDQASKTAMLNRLARVEGQIRGIQKLINQDEECEKVLQQLSAARKALDKAFSEMLSCIIEEDVLNTKNSGTSVDETMSHIKNLLSKYH